MRLIDADALIETVKNEKYDCYEEWDAIDRTINLIKHAPTIDAVEVVRGEWIEYRPPTNDYCGMVECPFCGEELIGEPTDFNYCPNCGAKMRLE